MPSRGFTRGRGRCALGLSHQWWGQLRQASRFPTRRPRGGCESSCAAEAAARRLPLKRQCGARLRADAEPRVYPRTGAIRSELESPVVGSIAPGVEISDSKARGGCESSCAAEAAARRLPLKRQCCARLRADAEPRVYPRTGAMRSGLESPVVGSIAPGFEISDSKAHGRHRPFTGRRRAAGLPALIKLLPSFQRQLFPV